MNICEMPFPILSLVSDAAHGREWVRRDVGNAAGDAGEYRADSKAVTRIATARLLQEDGVTGTWRARIDDHSVIEARVALSCLVSPLADDLVQLHVDADRCWILAILERASDAAALKLDAGKRTLHLCANDVHVDAAVGVAMVAPRVAVQTTIVTLAAEQRDAQIRGIDALSTGSLRIHADRHLGLHAKSTSVTASALLKLDAGQIHMG